MKEAQLTKANELSDRIYSLQNNLDKTNAPYNQAELSFDGREVLVSNLLCWPVVVKMVREELETKIVEAKKQFEEY